MFTSTSPAFIATQIDRVSRNSFIANGIGLALLAVFAWVSSAYYFCFFFGPFRVSDEDLLQLSKGSEGLLTYVELDNRRLLPTGWDEVVTRDDKLHEKSTYFLTLVGEQYLLVLAKTPGDGAHLVGPVYQVGKLEADVITQIVADRPELAGKIMPIMLNNTAAFTVAGYLGLALFVPALVLCSWNVARTMRGKLQPMHHPIVRHLRRYGDPEALAGQIDDDVRVGPTMQFGKSTLSSLWLLRPTLFGLSAVPLAELVWVYHLQRRSESLAILSLANGRQVRVYLKADQVDDLIAEISKRLPWVLCGYDLERYQSWTKNRVALIANVQSQRNLREQRT